MPRQLTAALSTSVAAIAIVVVSMMTSSVTAQAPDASDIAEGMRLYQQKGNCQACHGWAGDGRKTDNQMPDGANLRETKLPRNYHWSSDTPDALHWPTLEDALEVCDAFLRRRGARE